MNDITRMRHMLEYAQKARRVAKGRKRNELEHDETLCLALTRAVEVVGEAAARVSPAGRSKYPAIPWPKISGMRNRLIHGYDTVDLEVLWQTVEQDLLPLIESLKKIVPPEPSK